MTVLLVLAMFIVFLTIDYFYSRKRAAVPAGADLRVRPAAARGLRPHPDVVSGFALPVNFRYHPGHTWALSESPNLVRVGLDDFAARLIGKTARVNLPQRGRWIRQGQKIWTIERDGSTAAMVSPIEGVVTDINEAVVRNPELALRDPYREGWLVTVQSPDAQTNFRNLLTGALARKWIEEAAARLIGKMPALAGAVAQDGGVAVSDLSVHLPDTEWAELAREFFLS